MRLSEICTYIVSAALLLFMCVCWCEGATWYVRSSAGEYGAEDGSSCDAAWDGFTSVVQGAGGVVAGDTLDLCGDDFEEERLAWTESGTSGAHIIMRNSGTINCARWLTDGAGNNRAVGADPATQWVASGSEWYTYISYPAESYPPAGILEDGAWIYRGSGAGVLTVGQWFAAWVSPNWVLYYRPTTGTPDQHKVEQPYRGNGIYINGASYVDVSDVTVRGSNNSATVDAGGIVVHDSDHITLASVSSSYNARTGIRLVNSDDCTITDSSSFNNVCAGIRIEDSSYRFSIDGTSIYNNVRNTNYFVADKGGIIITPSPDVKYSAGGSIADSLVYSNGYAGLASSDTAIVVYLVSGVTIDGCKMYSNYMGPISFWGEAANDVTDNVLQRSLIYGNTCLAGDKGAVVARDTTGLNVYNNVIYGNTLGTTAEGAGLYIYASTSGNATNVLVKNNIIAENTKTGTTTHEVNIGAQSAVLTGSDFGANLYYRAAGGNYLRKSGTTYAWADWIITAGYDDDSPTPADPLLLDASSADFRPLPGSPAIGNGTDAGLTSDILGTKVPGCGGWPIGAYQAPAHVTEDGCFCGF